LTHAEDHASYNDAMMKMIKLDIKTLQLAYAGEPT
jgi:hypothetical protein